ncbi:beta-etherase [Parasphingopyxis marina]|uniref:Glutathione S-transferase N-terminal domain-containing protein n=1 Tax=Parasphingopyxis marina TaxID=2761622 RepID=A0A842HT69_9SPHN|nr:beta-etherase [Parasphingopyxis marina]MBC2777078.1 glutathione S-transferase N-terminal domain-containing protein [Parasphingopyxis marina]
MAENNKITLYDLQLESGATISPFVWAIKLALGHKGFDMDVVPGGFTGIMERTGGKTERLPAIVDDGEWVLDSWLIAEYLDEKYPDRPTLIGDPSIKVSAQFIEGWLWGTAVGPWMTCYVKSYRDRSLQVDHEYVTETRARMMGGKLEDIVVGREDRLPQISANLELLRGTLRSNDWFGGEAPNYVDHRLLGCFLWLASVADTPALASDDPLRDWLDRGFDLYGGLGRHPGLSDIFGLEQRPGDPELFDHNPREFGLNKRNTGPESTRAETAAIKGEAVNA